MAISTVKGEITRTFFDGKGAEVTESWQSNGDTMKKRWAAFFDQPHGLSEGDSVTISGMHSDKIDEWDKDGQTRRAVKRTLNKAKVEKPKGDSSQPVQSQPEPAGDVWNVPATYGDDDGQVPF